MCHSLWRFFDAGVGVGDGSDWCAICLQLQRYFSSQFFLLHSVTSMHMPYHPDTLSHVGLLKATTATYDGDSGESFNTCQAG